MLLVAWMGLYGVQVSDMLAAYDFGCIQQLARHID